MLKTSALFSWGTKIRENHSHGAEHSSNLHSLASWMELALVSASLSTDSADVENQRNILLGHQNMGERIIPMAPDHSADLHSFASWVWTATCRSSIQQGVCGR
ncbi:hypothetical protein INT47_006959 [Mucor saturninus]|uniref:Uncharacterized protein n=1 Tax=Mucor saturninus TaxID=64648 RepID=A0A8H7QQN1_9FUNG|nr:hypothetical protein INT47_006959 [Mucor saturninus]